MRSERAGMVYTKAHAVLPFPVVIRMTSRRVTPAMDGGTRTHAGVTTGNRRLY